MAPTATKLFCGSLAWLNVIGTMGRPQSLPMALLCAWLQIFHCSAQPILFEEVSSIAQLRVGPINDMAFDAAGNCWIASETGLICYGNGEARRFTRKNSALRDDRINCLLIDPQQQKWMGSYSKGLFCLDANGKFWHYPFADGGIRLITDIAMSASGQLFVSCNDGGIFRLEKEALQSHFHEKNSKLPSDQVNSLAFDANSHLWAGTSLGLAIFNGEKCEVFEDLESVQALAPQAGFVCSLTQQGPQVWQQEKNGKWKLLKAQNLPRLKGMLRSKTDIWLNGEEGLFRVRGAQWEQFGAKQGITHQDLSCATLDMGGGIWVGSSSGRLYRQQQLSPQIHEKRESNVFNADKITLETPLKLQYALFLQSSDSLLDPQKALQELADVAKYLQENPTVSLEIHGHTDGQGDPTQNWRLSKIRAESIGRLLVQLAVSAERIKTIWHGETQPIKPNHTEEGRKANRRVEIILRKGL